MFGLLPKKTVQTVLVLRQGLVMAYKASLLDFKVQLLQRTIHCEDDPFLIFFLLKLTTKKHFEK